ncbi:MAG: PDZ domain-containing protein [Steroidobacteraceae bacterium]
MRIVSTAATLASLLVAITVFGQTTAGAPDGAVPAAGQAGGRSARVQPSASDLDARLTAAQRRLDEAAREVAQLAAERGQVVMRRYAFMAPPPRAVIGIQLDAASGGAGARVLDVSPGGPAAEAGVRAGDVITAVNGTDVKGDDAARQVVRIVRDLKPESKVRIEVSRNGKAQQFTLTARRGAGFEFLGAGPLGAGPPRMGPPGPMMPALPATPATAAPPLAAFGPLGPQFLALGPLADMELATLTARLGTYFGTDRGVLVVRAPAGGALKLEDGDVILSIDGRVPASGPHATRILASYQPGEKIDLRVMRDRKRLDIATTMPQGAPRAPGRVVIVRRRESI